uniref:VioE domain-containing protein n=1 Tax=gamma proteobacterium D250 TaxID=649546 RepID=M4HX81_9GAMM|nr:hypothetical protein PTD2_19497 [gamma proteobacterium D250]
MSLKNVTPALWVGRRCWGQDAEVWTFERPEGKGPATYYFASGTNQLLRMVTGDPNTMASIRDFPNFNTRKIDPEVFKSTE